MTKCSTVTVLFAIAAFCGAQVDFPTYITPCGSSDGDCLEKLLKKLVPHLVEGIPEFDLPSIDPLELPNYNQSYGHLYFATFTDLKYEGLSNFNVLKFYIYLNTMKFVLSIVFPEVLVSAYEVVSVVGCGYRLNGSGLAKATVSNLTVSFSLDGKSSLIKDKVRVTWKEDAISVSYDDVLYEPDASFRGGKIFKIFNPQIQKIIKNTFGKFVLQRINFVHEKYPLEVLYCTYPRNPKCKPL